VRAARSSGHSPRGVSHSGQPAAPLPSSSCTSSAEGTATRQPNAAPANRPAGRGGFGRPRARQLAAPWPDAGRDSLQLARGGRLAGRRLARARREVQIWEHPRRCASPRRSVGGGAANGGRPPAKHQRQTARAPRCRFDRRCWREDVALRCMLRALSRRELQRTPGGWQWMVWSRAVQLARKLAVLSGKTGSWSPY